MKLPLKYHKIANYKVKPWNFRTKINNVGLFSTPRLFLVNFIPFQFHANTSKNIYPWFNLLKIV